MEYNLSVYIITFSLLGRFAKYSLNLKGGIIVKQTKSNILYLPYRILHIVFIIKGGFIINFTFSFIEGLSIMA